VFLTESETSLSLNEEPDKQLEPVSEDPVASPTDESPSKRFDDPSLDQTQSQPLSLTHQLRHTLNYDRIYTTTEIEWGGVGCAGRLTSTW
jgi:hypothetical protein